MNEVLSCIHNILKKFFIFSFILFGLLVYYIGITKIINLYIVKMNHNYILVSRNKINSIVCIVIPLIIFSIIFFHIKINKCKKNIFYYLMLTVLTTGFIYSLNRYDVIYNERIERKNLVSSFSKEYNYSDIQCVSIGIDIKARRYLELYYYLHFNDGNKIAISNELGDYCSNIDKLIQINISIKERNIPIRIDDAYLNLYIKDYDEENKKKLKVLFNE